MGIVDTWPITVYTKRRRDAQYRKYITYRNAARGEPSHGHMQHAADKIQTHTHTHTHTLITILRVLLGGEIKKVKSHAVLQRLHHDSSC